MKAALVKPPNPWQEVDVHAFLDSTNGEALRAPGSRSTAEFVADAVRENLAWLERKAEFFRLSDETRRQMDKQGIDEAEILGDFDAVRESPTRD